MWNAQWMLMVVSDELLHLSAHREQGWINCYYLFIYYIAIIYYLHCNNDLIPNPYKFLLAYRLLVNVSLVDHCFTGCCKMFNVELKENWEWLGPQALNPLSALLPGSRSPYSPLHLTPANNHLIALISIPPSAWGMGYISSFHSTSFCPWPEAC